MKRSLSVFFCLASASLISFEAAAQTSFSPLEMVNIPGGSLNFILALTTIKSVVILSL